MSEEPKASRPGRRASVPLALAAAAAIASPAAAEPCPQALADALRLVLVTAQDADAPAAILETFERASTAEPWRAIGGLRPAVVGLKGAAWGAGFRHLAREGEPLKQEGDRRSPIGIYRIGAPFGSDAQSLPGYMKLQLGQHVCVEEPRSQSYGRIVASTAVEKGVKYDEMAKEPLYRHGFVVDYPADGANRAGSCIFLHVWREAGKGTAGCVGMAEADVAELRAWTSEKPSAIAILTPAARTLFAACLP